jgi:tetratricopeptide (TPR) repeat protein
LTLGRGGRKGILSLSAAAGGSVVMNRAIFGAVVATALAGASCGWAQPACFEAPTRACVLDALHEVVVGLERQELRLRPLIAIADTRAKAGLATAAAATLAEALKIAQGITNEQRRSFALTEIAVTQANSGNIPAALALLPSITGDRATALRALAEAYARAGQTRDAADTFAEVLRVAQSRETETQRRFELGLLFAAQLRAGLLADARAVAETFRDDLRFDAYRQLAGAQAKAGNADAALSMVEGLSDQGWRAAALREIAIALADTGNILAATTVALSIPQELAHSGAMRAIARAHARAGHTSAAADAIAEAFNDALSLPEGAARIAIFGEIGITQADLGLKSDAERSFQEAIEDAQAFPDILARGRLYRFIAGWQATAGLTKEAGVTFDLALQAATAIVSKPDRVKALAEIVEAQVAAGFAPAATATFDLALKAVQEIADQGDRDAALVGLALARARMAKFAEALAIVRQLGNAGRQASALSLLAPAVGSLRN